MALVDGPMRREVAIRWTNRKRDGAVWACATQINKCTEFADASDDDRDPMMFQEEGTSLILSLKRTFLGANHFCRFRGPEISSCKGNEPIWKASIQKEPLTANR